MKLRSRTRKSKENPDIPKSYSVDSSTISFQSSPRLPPKLRDGIAPSQILDYSPSMPGLPPKQNLPGFPPWQSIHYKSNVTTFSFEISPKLPTKINIQNKHIKPDVNIPSASSSSNTPTSSHTGTMPKVRKFP